jgi:hypothetical protein
MNGILLENVKNGLFEFGTTLFNQSLNLMKDMDITLKQPSESVTNDLLMDGR